MRAYTKLSKSYVPDEKYLFLGNGLNQLKTGYSWGDLLESIKDDSKIKTRIGNKTYPLYFEELSFALDPKREVERNIKALKKRIADNALALQPNEFHREIIGLNHYLHFLTTNYDYCIERTLDPSGKKLRHEDKLTSKYSLYRYNQINDHHVWHIHGECDNGRKNDSANSILIGFEHYADYLNKVHRILKSDTGKGLAEQIAVARYNWPHKFFTHDIDIVGFGLDFNETHLWFILNFRARLLRKNVTIKNKIRWFIPDLETNNGDKADLLHMMQVEVVPLSGATYPEYYQEFIKRIRNESHRKKA